MKRLTKLKLINWHRFTNNTFEFGSSTLISGENGAGKSTLLDAIQFVIICATTSFNKAAHENGKRKLTGYIRCKTGKENRPYERTGPISAHVALEFYEEKEDRYFVVGAVVDSASEGQETTARYLIEDTRLSDEMFFNGSVPKSISEFRNTAPEIRQWCKTQTEARKMIQARLGRIEDKFFSLIPKALAFKPINDIKDFVYSYVLDEKEVNIEGLKDNVRAYQDLERTLDSVRGKMKQLEEIEAAYREVEKCTNVRERCNFFIARAELDETGSLIKKLEEDIEGDQYRIREEKQSLNSVEGKKEQAFELETNLRVQLKQNKEYLALEETQKELDRMKEKEIELLKEKYELSHSVERALQNVKNLLREKEIPQCVKAYADALEFFPPEDDIASVRQLIEEVLRAKGDLYGKIQHRIAERQIQLKELKSEKDELGERIHALERRKLSYPSAVELLMRAIREEFIRLGKKEEPHVLCEMLEITDEEWRNAVEGYLNTQRFYVLVEPDDFDIALGIYDKLRREKKVFGAGLINTKKLDAYKASPEGTLASVVTSANIHASQYANMILGKVALCEKYKDLKKHNTAITKECMKYQNQVASAIRPDIFKVPFIGENATEIQLLQVQKKEQEIAENMGAHQDRITAMKEMLAALDTEDDMDIKYRIEVIPKLAALQSEIAACSDNIERLKENNTLIEQQIQLEQIQKSRKELEQEFAEKNKKIGHLENKVEQNRIKLEDTIVRRSDMQVFVADILRKTKDSVEQWQKEYEDAVEKKSYSQIKDEMEKKRRQNEGRLKAADSQMVDRMIRYRTSYDFGAAASVEGFPEYAAVYDRLRTSELVHYEVKVQSARTAAEEEFREQFLAKLQENMKQAQGAFKHLNKALEGIAFSNEKYKFIQLPSAKHRKYYEMIMDDFNIIQGESIFSGPFHETHKEVIEELFDRLAVYNQDNEKTLNEFTDYRTYMDYDIQILHMDGSHSFYSKVCEEKSGGETQTPFYVTVAASFVQLYANNIGGEAAGLVMFDEAFNNMDDERIGGVLEFLRRLPLQIIIAAPPDKIQYISPAMEETLLIMTDGKISYAEEYFNPLLADEQEIQ